MVVAVIAAGCDTDTVFVTVEEAASVTLTEYVPAANPLAEAPVPPLGDHEYV